MSRISVGRLWFAGIPPGDIGWILVITPDTYPEYSLMDTEIIPRTAPPQLHTWSFGKKQKLNIKSWTSDTVLMVTMTINGRPLRRSQLRIWAALFPPFPLPPSHWHPALTSTWCWTQNNLMSLKSIKSAVGRSVFTIMTFCPQICEEISILMTQDIGKNGNNFKLIIFFKECALNDVR